MSSGAAAVTAGCGTDNVDKLIGRLVDPEQQTPGIAQFYASTCRECTSGCGVHVTVREGRAIKLEGNPESPVNRGKLCQRGQSALQGLYDPDRLRGPMARGGSGTLEPITWDEALEQLARRLGGATGVAFVTGHETGSFGRLVEEWTGLLPGGRTLRYEAFGHEALRAANRATFGIDAIPTFDLGAAKYVLSFGADFLETWLNPVSNTSGYAQGHGFHDGAMGKAVYVSSRMGLTGMNADEWIAIRPGAEVHLALSIAHVILRDGLGAQPRDVAGLRSSLADYAPEAVAERAGVEAETIVRLAGEFAGADGAVALAGGGGALHEDADALCAAANILNYITGNVGLTVRFGPNLNTEGLGTYADLRALMAEMESGAVDLLLVHGANPAHTVPDGAAWRRAADGVAFKVCFSSYMDETAAQCDLVLPDHHPIEQWADSWPVAGVAALQQPVMAPVFDTRQTGDVLIQLAGQLGLGSFPEDFKSYVQNAWRPVVSGGDFDTSWREALQRGGVYQDVGVTPVRLAAGAGAIAPATASAGESLLALAFPSQQFFDGRGANKSWLQELPDPVTKVTWQTWVEMHPETAAEVGVVRGDVVRLASSHGTIEAPVVVHDAIRPGVVGVPIGQGHEAYGRYAQGRGANALRLLNPEATRFGGLALSVGVSASFTGEHRRLASTEGSARQHDREIARAMTLGAAAALGDHAAGEHHLPIGEQEEAALEGWAEAQERKREIGNYEGEQARWAMTIDLARCTGCSACVTACHAENNIPAVGEEHVIRGRELSWIRIERYWEGGEHGEPLSANFVPMLCQQCGNAPCEPVCPVFAAYHTPDGLNAQVYNRCVGTRYCANNCPYKVRYFNWFDFSGETPGPFNSFPEPLGMQLNPEVTVRTKGVMEKCTFCVQRIRGAQHRAVLEDREVRDGEIVTACQQTCPADAIVFGDLTDADSTVHHHAEDPRGYHVFEELNVKPGVTYLARVTNRTEA